MCAVIGCFANKSDEVLFYLKRLFKESQIRGRHATGLSFIENGEILTLSEPIPSKEFAKNFDFNELPNDIRLIGHCRYSTSDLRFNQPINSDKNSIVHNGVISQEDPVYWKKHFGYDCDTANDSELILKSIESGNHPLKEFYNTSMSVITISDNHFKFFRNGNRPLWYLEFNNSIFVASTNDIFLRSFGKVEPINCEAGIEYEVKNFSILNKKIVDNIDFQIDLECSNYYSKVIL